jgi:mannose-6-phosphate isomerase
VTQVEPVGRWVWNELLPAWEKRVRHPDGGYADGLTLEGVADWQAPRTLLLQARLAYTFAAASVGDHGNAWALDAARRALSLITEAFPSRDGGFVKAIASSGGPPGDPTRDFYDHTFILLAAATLHRVTGEAAHRALLDQVFHFLEIRLAHPAGGFRETVEPLGTPRRQNPHMHLLEGLLAAYDATGEAIWLARARSIVDLFLHAFFEPATGTLIEFLTEDLRALPDERGRWREPGHHFEWVWLLLDYHHKAGDERVINPALRLFETGHLYGLRRFSEGVAVIEAMRSDGTVLSLNQLLWPQTEYVKAQVARDMYLGVSGARDEAGAHLRRLRNTHFQTGGVLWANSLDPDGVALSSFVPARVLYHLAFAVAAYEADLLPARP